MKLLLIRLGDRALFRYRVTRVHVSCVRYHTLSCLHMFCVHVFFDDVYNVLVYINIVVVIPLVRGNIFILKKIEFLYRYIFK